MIPDVTPSGVFYLPPTGWLTSFYNPPKLLSKKQLKYSKALHAVKLLGAVFHKENGLVYQTEEEKRQQRITHVKPLLDRFYQYLGSITSPQGRLCAAIKNALKLRTRVYRIFENGQIPLSNNSLEGEIRFTTLVRKNCLFAKSVRGAEANAIYYTLVATAKTNKLNVYKYFKYLFDRLPNQKRSDIEAFLPWAEEVQQVCHNQRRGVNRKKPRLTPFHLFSIRIVIDCLRYGVLTP